MQSQLFPYSPERDVYRLLQVEPSAAPDEINAAVRRLARTFHPDRNWSPRATQEMQVVNAVRSLLIDPQARATYDRARHRFLAETAARSERRVTRLVAHPAVARHARTAPAIAIPRSVTSVLTLTGQALMAALRALLDAFRPRCSVCWALADFDHRYCAACGAPLGQPRPLPGR
ncbi:MAG TPA: J domain-containing protein [Candidatus Limnocylindria bacterium]|jgi:curved DNA-binding protein CbpA